MMYLLRKDSNSKGTVGFTPTVNGVNGVVLPLSSGVRGKNLLQFYTEKSIFCIFVFEV